MKFTVMLKEKILDDLKAAMKSQNALKTGVLRMVLSAIKNKEIEARGKAKNGELGEDDVLNIVKKETRKRKEAAEIYIKNNRPDLAQKESSEAELLSSYLPEEMNAEEIIKIVRQTVKEIDSYDLKNFGKVMGAVMKKVNGRASAEIVSAEVKKALI